MKVRFLALAGFAAMVLLAANPLIEARRRYQNTDFAGAERILRAMPERDAETTELLGQAYYMLGDYKKAAESLEQAAADVPGDSSYQHWVGKAYGRRAETSFALTAIGFANKARVAFEKAVQLDPKNVEAVSDLFEFYLQAPGFLGGGFDKASRLAGEIAKRDPGEGYYARARLAEERKEYVTAESQLRRAMELAPSRVGRIIDLAEFLSKRGRYEESDKTFVQAQKVAPDAPKILFARADTYIRANRNLDQAKDLLKKYMAANITPEDPSKLEAAKLLKRASGS